MNKNINDLRANMQKAKQHGFSLIEILIAVAIVGILAAVAWPSYQNSVMKSRRADGKAALLDATARQEKFFMQQNRYSGDVNDLGGATSDDGNYIISVTQNDGITTYLLTATATAAQADDTKCAAFTVNHIGLQKAYDSGGNENTSCW